MWERQRGGGASAAGLDMGLVRELFQMDTGAERKKKSSLALPAPARLFVEQLHELSVLTAHTFPYTHPEEPHCALMIL